MSPPGYDSARDRVVLFVGVNDKPQHMLNDVWEFDGQTWMEKKPNNRKQLKDVRT